MVVRPKGQPDSKPFPFPTSREGFEAAVGLLRQQAPGAALSSLLVGIEFAGNYGFTFAHFLAQLGAPVVSVLPAHTKRWKDVAHNQPLKTDAKDAAQICKLVGDGIFVRFPFLRSPFVELRLLVTQRYRLTVEETRFKNRLQGLLDLAWPEFLAQFGNLRKVTPRAVLARWPLPQDLVAASPRTVARLMDAASRGHMPPERVRALLDAAKSTIALTQAAPERRLEIQYLLTRWTLVRQQLADLDQPIAGVVEACPEAKILTTIPEVSAVSAATIVAELGTPADYVHPRQILKLAGMNLVEKSSASIRGRKRQSKRGRPMLRRQLFLLAGRWCQTRGLYRPDYEALLARNGGLRTKAVCALARKLVPLLFAVLQSGQPFDVVRWHANRHQRPGGSSNGATQRMEHAHG
jgi:transposase